MDFFILCTAALITSTISGVIGMAGGIMLLTIMAQFFEPELLIPLHGVVQLASNSTRAVFYREHIEWTRTQKFALGAVIGAGMAFLVPQMLFSLPPHWYKLAIAGFVLVMTWVPRPKMNRTGPYKFFGLGGVAAFLSLFVGTVGPLIAPFFLSEGLKKEQMVATKASCQAVVHTLKIMVFIIFGVTFYEYIPLLAAMVAMVSLGSWIGRKLIGHLPERLFIHIFKGTITILALRMAYLAL